MSDGHENEWIVCDACGWQTPWTEADATLIGNMCEETDEDTGDLCEGTLGVESDA